MKNILFDFDGTLADTLPLCIAAFRNAIEPLAGRKLSDTDIIETFGPSEEGTIAALLPKDKTDAGMDGYLKNYELLHDQCPTPFPGVHELLHNLKSTGAFIGLITGKGARSAVVSLDRYDLHKYFHTIQTGSPAGPVKDQRIEAVIEEFGLERAQTLYVGDAPSDITASHGCGIQVAAAAWAATADITALRELNPDYLFTDFSAFASFLLKRVREG